ncbi:MAG TPA: flagellar export protein FliJ [Deltaproteobacteria bacterium]|nr:flagellar export protein FliJ [Deltaproteobacteria bacterium]HPP80724.1 flagellar export protein FliJ [Deltaproteobacteria bacterium]
MAFTFKFSTLLKVRKIQEDLARQQLAEAARQLTSILALRSQVEARKALLSAELLAAMSDGMKAHEVKAVSDYLYHLEERLVRLQDAVEKATRRVEEEREKVVKARKAHKAIERLREIHLERYKAEQDRLEMNFIDEIAVMGAGGRV